MAFVFYWLSKLAWLVIVMDSLLVLLIIICWLLLMLGAIRAAKRMLGLLALLTTVIALFPVGEWVLYPLESRFATNPALPAKIDGVIMLSGGGSQRLSAQWQQPELSDAADRYLAFMAFARRYPEAKLVFTGGSASMLWQEFKGADLARTVLENQGIDPNRVLFEGESRNTYENVIFSKRLVEPQAGEHWVLITSAWHMPRSVGIFCKAGWPVIPYPVDHSSNPDYLFRVDLGFAAHLRNLNAGVKEWVGLVAYYLTGKTAEFLPGGCVG